MLPRSMRPLFAVLAFALTVPAFAAPPPASTLDAKARAAILDSLSARLLSDYVEADTAKLIVERLKKQRKKGAYDSATDVQTFAERVTTDLRSVNGDLHLSLRYDPEAASSGGNGPVIVRTQVSGGPGAPGAMPERRVVIDGGAAADSGAPQRGGARMMPGMGEAQQRNFGLTKAEILPGNVGYLRVSMFLGAPGYRDAMVAALRFLERTDAMIIDVRDNGGGSGEMSHLLFSHFLGAQPVPTINVKSRIPGMSREQTSVADVPGPRRPDVPLWVLTSRGTGSAAEEFSFVLSNLKRATLIGEPTAGAGHMVNGYPMPDGFVAGISITRVSDPRSGREWEAVGVQPDLRVPADQALDVAHAAALKKIAETAPPDRQRALAMQAEWIEARDANVAVPVERSAAIVGRYDGDRVVTLENGHLLFQRSGRSRMEMTPLADGRFSMNGEARFEFSSDTPASTMTIERADGSRQVCKRITGAN